MIKAIIATGIFAALAAIVFKKGDFGAIPTKADCIEYKKRCPHHTGKHFTYLDKWEETGLPEDKRVSSKGTSPADKLPICVPNLKTVAIDQIKVTWFGHSTILLQIHDMNILFDSMFSERSSPFQWVEPKRFTHPSIGIDELPHIDAVLISHDHYDHLDRRTVQQLDRKTDRFIVSLGLDKHLEKWHISSEKITSLAWWESIDINGLKITCTPSRHFSGRGIVGQNSTQWCSWVLRDEYHCIFNSCDGSYGGHFKAIQEHFTNFDLAFMECGQYNKNWHYSHLYPEESVMTAKILNAKKVMPIHWGAFTLSTHGWDDGPERFVTEAEKQDLCVITPHLCETFSLDDTPTVNYWWRKYN